MDGYLALLDESNEALKRTGESLLMAADGMAPGRSLILAYIQQQALSVAHVALDVCLLLSHQRFQNVLGLCRIAFESRISVYAAMRVPDFAAQKYLTGIKGHVEQLEAHLKSGGKDPLLQGELEQQRRLLGEFRRDFPDMPEKTWWKFEDVAKAAGVMKDYEAHYSMLSKAAHNTPTGLASKTDSRILAVSSLELLHDTAKTAAVLVFFDPPGVQQPGPITTRWKDLLSMIQAEQKWYEAMRQRLIDLVTEEFPQ